MILPFFFLFITLFLSYLPAFFVEYAHHDGYILLTKIPGHISAHPLSEKSFMMGRFLSVPFANLYRALPSDMNDMGLLRFITFAMIFFTACIYFRFIHRCLSNTLFSFFVCILTFTLPSFSSFIAWEVPAVAPANVLSALAAVIIIVMPPLSFSKSLMNKKMLIGFILLLSAQSTYPSSATFYWAFVAGVFLFFKRGENRKIHLLRLVFVGLLSIAIYGLILQFTRQYFMNSLVNSYNPYFITKNPIQKLTWFISEPFFNTLNLWNIIPDKRYAFFVLLLIFTGGLAAFIRNFREQQSLNRTCRTAIGCIVLMTALISLSYLPNLMSITDIASYRCTTGLSSILILVCIWALREIQIFFWGSAHKLITVGILLTIAVNGLLRNYDTVLYYRAIPSYLEFNFIKNELKSLPLEHYNRIHFILPVRHPPYRYDEFGTPTSYFFETSCAMLFSAIAQNHKDKKIQYIRIESADGYINLKFSDSSGRLTTYNLNLSFSFGAETFERNAATYVLDMRRFTEAYKIFLKKECRYCK